MLHGSSKIRVYYVCTDTRDHCSKKSPQQYRNMCVRISLCGSSDNHAKGFQMPVLYTTSIFHCVQTYNYGIHVHIHIQYVHVGWWM